MRSVWLYTHGQTYVQENCQGSDSEDVISPYIKVLAHNGYAPTIAPCKSLKSFQKVKYQPSVVHPVRLNANIDEINW